MNSSPIFPRALSFIRLYVILMLNFRFIQTLENLVTGTMNKPKPAPPQSGDSKQESPKGGDSKEQTQENMEVE